MSADVLAARTTSLKALRLTALGATLPALLEQARQQQPIYDIFLQQAMDTELAGRATRAHARRLHAARLPAHNRRTRRWRRLTSASNPVSLSGSCASWPA